MGYNTALMVCNDGLDQFLRDPQVGEKLYKGVLGAGLRKENYISIGNHCNPVSILQSQHADVDQLVLVGGNTISPVHSFFRIMVGDTGRGSKSEPLAERVIHALAEDLGYNLSKKAWRKRRDARDSDGDDSAVPPKSGNRPSPERTPHV